MASTDIRFTNLREDLGFGTRVWGVTRENLKDADNRKQIFQAFEDRGLLIFEEVEQSSEMQLAISEVLGPLKDHPVAAVSRAAEDMAKGIIDLKSDVNEDTSVVEIDGKPIHNWLTWHFDHSYNNELNRAGVLRPMVIAPEGGLTGFADGIDLYNKMPADLRARIEGKAVVYTLDLLFENMRFGKPDNFRVIKEAQASRDVSALAKNQPRSIHPAVWTRKNGEKVLHVGGLHAVGLEGLENPEGDELLREVCRYIAANPNPYYHKWSLGQMLTWDNWRILHCVTGADPKYPRRMHRTTIRGDYGLGRFEGGEVGGKVLERTM